MTRPKAPAKVETQLLTLCRRRCAICFGLEGDLSQKRGQIAHLDGNHSNNSADNLTFLCLEHHDQYDSSTSQSKGLQLREVKIYRESLYKAVRQYLAREPDSGESADQESAALLAQGELAFYLAQGQIHLDEGTRILRDMHKILSRYAEQTNDRTAQLGRLLSEPGLNLRAAKDLDHLGGSQMVSFANELVASGAPLAMVTTRMATFLVRASAVASDIEHFDRTMLEDKLRLLRQMCELYATTIRNASACRDQTATFRRGSKTFNRGKRLVVAAIDENISQLSRSADAIQAAEADLQKLLTLL